ncbi:hypothetical protein EJF84_18080 [Salmonella enterica]|nr:hypothetical protein [Salmonella enterica]
MSKSLSWRRVRALCVKETRQIVRDPSSWLIAVVIVTRQSILDKKTCNSGSRLAGKVIQN